MPRRAAAAFASLLALTAGACRRDRFEPPRRLLLEKTTEGRLARTGALSAGDETRPALLETATYTVTLPPRALLTFGEGMSPTSGGEPPGWYRLTVRAGNRVLLDDKLNPRATHGFRDVSVPLEGLGGKTTLQFDLRLTDRFDKPIALPPDLLLGVADPIVHDLEAYGRAKGVVLVSIDTLRRDHVGAYGYARPTTPRLDALSGDGVFCEDAVSTSSWTLPAHLSLMTSTDPGVHGGIDIEHGFNHHTPTLARRLREAGFATHAVTSHLYVSSVYGLDDGFDRLDFRQDRKATDVAERAIDLLDRVGDRPFFVFLHFYDPHWHYDPPETTRKLFERPYTGTITGLWQDFSKRRDVTPADRDHLIDLYDGEIRYVDDELGRVLDHLRKRALDRGTLLVVASDHGEEFQEHGSWEHQRTLYEEVTRVPLFFRGPGVGPRREKAQVSLLDVAPTILAWAGLAIPEQAQGQSLLRSPGDREAYGETDHTNDGTFKLFLRGGQGRWKTIVSLDGKDKRPRRDEWYELSSDPGETRNAPPAANVAESLRNRLIARWRQDRERGAGAPQVRLTPEQRERLRALGYVGP